MNFFSPKYSGATLKRRKDMNRSQYFNYIEDKLSCLAASITSRGRLNLLDLHIHSENFYRDLLNILFDWELENLTETEQKIAAIDLIDYKNKLLPLIPML